MKKLFLFIFTFLGIFSQIIAQAPDAFKYQAVARDLSGAVLASEPVNFRMKIAQTTAGGTVVYTETHAVTTNQFGLANLEIGNGSIVLGDFSTIDWGADSYYLLVELDPTGGTSFASMGSSQLLSVPYALHAKSVTNADDDWKYFSGSDSTGDIYHIGDIALGEWTTDPDGHGLFIQNYNSGKAAVRAVDQNVSSGNLYAEAQLGVLSLSGLPISVTNIGVLGIKHALGGSGAAVYGWNNDDNSSNYAGLFVADGTPGSGTNYGVYASATGAGTNNYAGYFEGAVFTKQGTANRGFWFEHESTSDNWSMGIGTSTKNCRWEYNGAGKGQISSVDGTYSTISDRRLKTDISPLGSMLNNIMRLEASTYKFKNTEATHKSIGFISQEVEEIFPDLVRIDDEGYKWLAYSDFGVIAIKGIQEQQEVIENQNTEIETLKSQMAEILLQMEDLHSELKNLK